MIPAISKKSNAWRCKIFLLWKCQIEVFRRELFTELEVLNLCFRAPQLLLQASQGPLTSLEATDGQHWKLQWVGLWLLYDICWNQCFILHWQRCFPSPTWKFDIDASSVSFEGVEAIVGSCKRRPCSQQSSTRSSKDARMQLKQSDEDCSCWIWYPMQCGPPTKTAFLQSQETPRS